MGKIFIVPRSGRSGSMLVIFLKNCCLMEQTTAYSIHQPMYVSKSHLVGADSHMVYLGGR